MLGKLAYVLKINYKKTRNAGDADRHDFYYMPDREQDKIGDANRELSPNARNWTVSDRLSGFQICLYCEAAGGWTTVARFLEPPAYCPGQSGCS